MEVYQGVAITDGLNRKNHFMLLSTILKAYRDAWDRPIPMNIGHDRTKPIGYTKLTGVYMEPGKAYVTNESAIMETSEEHAKRMTIELPSQDKYDKVIFGWYERCLLSEDERIRNQAADSLFHAFIRQEDYEKAAQYLDYFSLENPDRKRKEALVNSKTGKRTEAYRAYEELIFSAYQHIQMTLNDLRILYMEDDDHEMARKLVEVSSSAASTFEMGKYNEICFGLDVAAWEKDIEWTAQLMQEILDSIGTISAFTKSKLYQHMALKTVDSNFSASLKRELLKSLEDESFNYMQGNEDWEKLKSDVY